MFRECDLVYISAIIPAFNEESTIANVLNTLKMADNINEIIVVSDGSTDDTALISRRCGARVVELPQNRGKGAAIKAGLNICRGDIILLLDADLVGLKTVHVESLLKPVAAARSDMAVGVFSNGRFSTDMAQKITPQLSGQRAVRKWILDRMANLELSGYGVEVALTRYAEEENIPVLFVELADLTHITKEEKLGFFRGFAQRLKMYWEILKGLSLARR